MCTTIIKKGSAKIYLLGTVKLGDSKLLNSKQSVVGKLFNDNHFANLLTGRSGSMKMIGQRCQNSNFLQASLTETPLPAFAG